MRNFPRPTQGVLFVVSGPSGVGKSTLLKRVLDQVPDLSFSVSATTRDPRVGETDGVDYHFIEQERFSEMVAQGDFLEHATVYSRSYGTLAEPVRKALSMGHSILLDIDVQGARAVRQSMPEAVFIMIAPPNVATLRARLNGRNTDSDEIIAGRMAKVAQQLGAIEEYDYLVVNDDLDTAHRQMEALFLAELSRTSRHGQRVRSILDELSGAHA